MSYEGFGKTEQITGLSKPSMMTNDQWSRVLARVLPHPPPPQNTTKYSFLAIMVRIP